MKTVVVACAILCWMQYLPEVECACLFPNQLQNGTWFSSVMGALSFSSTTNTTSIAAYKTQRFGTVALACFVAADDKYVFKSTNNITLLGLKWEVHICFKLATTGFENKYVYHLGSVENADALNERFKAAIVGTRTPTVAFVCDRTTYDAGTENILLKNDGTEETAAIHFPHALRGTWQYEFQSAASVNKYCRSNSSMEICRANDTKTMDFDYDKCSTMQAYSAGGRLQAMWYSNSSNYTYIHVYNTDNSTDEVTTFRFTCYVIDNNATENSSLISTTQYPKQCAKTQTPTSVVAPGAFLVFNRTDNCVNLTTTAAPTTMVTTTVPEAVPVVTEQSTVISTASAVGVAIGVIILFLILVCACLIYLYYRKRKEKEAEADRLPLSKAHPANIRLKNSDLYRESLRKREKPTLMTETKSNGAVNGDVKLDIDKDPGIQRENSIYFTMNSRGGSGMGPLETPNIRPGSVAPVEEPDKVNNPADQTIAESEFETTAADAVLASTFLPISPDDHAELNYTDAEIREIERKAEKEKEKDNEKDEFDMDEIDDELGLPRLSRAFTPVAQPQPEPATLPSIAYKKQVDDTGSLDDTREDGIKKVKVKKHLRKKKRALSSRESLQDRLASAMGRAESFNKETPFLERIKKMDKEKAELEQKAQLEKEMKQIENEVIKARLPKPATNTTPSSKYLVDSAGGQSLQRPDKGSSAKAPHSGDRRRFGDVSAESSRTNRKRTPRLRHPMEIQADEEKVKEKEVLKKNQGFWKDERRARSGRRREHPEALTIPSLKEDPFDHKEPTKPTTAPVFSAAPVGKSAVSMRLEREKSTFIEPPTDPKTSDAVFEKASHLWNYKTQTFWGGGV